MSIIIDQIADWFVNKLRLKSKDYSYRRLIRCVDSPPDQLVDILYGLESPTTGLKLESAFRLSMIDIRFGKAHVRNRVEKIILLDIKSSGYEKVSGRYVVYTLSEVSPRLYHVNYTVHGFNRLPAFWKEDCVMARHNFM